MLARDYSEEEIRELFMEDGRREGIKEGRREERKNTEAERRRADAAEAEIRQLKEELARLKAQLA